MCHDCSTSHQKFLHEAIAYIVRLEVHDGLYVVTSKSQVSSRMASPTLNAILQVWVHLNTHYTLGIKCSEFGQVGLSLRSAVSTISIIKIQDGADEE